VLFLLFIVQFVVACACLAIGPSQQKALFSTGWYEAEGLRGKMQRQFDCCGAFAESANDTGLRHPPCNLTSVSRTACLKYVNFIKGWLGGSVVRALARDRKVASSTPGQSATE